MQGEQTDPRVSFPDIHASTQVHGPTDLLRRPRTQLASSALLRPRPFAADGEIFPDRPVSRRGQRQPDFSAAFPRQLHRPLARQRRESVWAPYGLREPVQGVDVRSDAQYTRTSDAPYEEEPEPEPAPGTPPAEPGSDLAWPVVDVWPARTDLDPPASQSGRARKSKPGTEGPFGTARADSEEAPSKPRRLGRSVYDAMETHGHFGLVDSGEPSAGGVRKVIVHVPKRNRGYALDVKPGDVIHANSARGKALSARLEVVYVSRHRYTPPGHAVTSCAIGVPDHSWVRFVE